MATPPRLPRPRGAARRRVRPEAVRAAPAPQRAQLPVRRRAQRARARVGVLLLVGPHAVAAQQVRDRGHGVGAGRGAAGAACGAVFSDVAGATKTELQLPRRRVRVVFAAPARHDDAVAGQREVLWESLEDLIRVERHVRCSLFSPDASLSLSVSETNGMSSSMLWPSLDRAMGPFEPLKRCSSAARAGLVSVSTKILALLTCARTPRNERNFIFWCRVGVFRW